MKQKLIKKTVEVNKSINEVSNRLKSMSNDKVTVICSGNNSNEEIEAIKEFAKANNYNLALYTDNFTNYDGEVATYDDVDNASFIFIIGEIFDNPLVARRVIHAHRKGTEICAIGDLENCVTKTLSDYTCVESISEYLDNFNLDQLDENSVILFNKIESPDDFEKIKTIAGKYNSKILPVFSKSNSKGALEFVEAKSKEEMIDLITNSGLLLIFNDDILTEFNLSPNDVTIMISISPVINDTVEASEVVVPTANWLECEGSFTNAMGTTKYINPVIEAADDILTGIEIINQIQEELK